MKALLLLVYFFSASASFARLPVVDFSSAVESAASVDFEAMEAMAWGQGRSPEVLRQLAASYLNAHRVQEAIWTLREAGDLDEALELTRQFQSFLSTQPTSGGDFLGGRGGRKARRVYYSGAISGVFKQALGRSGDADYELAAYWLDELLGLDVVPITVLVAHPEFGVGSMQYFVHGPRALTVVSPRHREDRMRLIDLILSNKDRNSGNWLVRPGGFVVAIDHGNSNPLTIFLEWNFPAGILEDKPLLQRILRLRYSAFEQRLGNVLVKKSLDAVWRRIQRLKEEILVHKPDLGSCAWRVGTSILRLCRRF